MTPTDTVRDPDHTGRRMRWNPCLRGTTQSRFLKVKCNPPKRHFRQFLAFVHTGLYTPVILQHNKSSKFPIEE